MHRYETNDQSSEACDGETQIGSSSSNGTTEKQTYIIRPCNRCTKDETTAIEGSIDVPMD